MTHRKALQMDDSTIARYWKYVNVERDANGCQLWTGTKNRHGYGVLGIAGTRKSVLAHRLACELRDGAPVPRNLCVCHHCDAPACQSPDHLFVGTKSENSADMAKKGRARGRPPVLTPEQAVTIYQRLLGGAAPMDLVHEYDVSTGVIYGIRDGSNWSRLLRGEPNKRYSRR